MYVYVCILYSKKLWQIWRIAVIHQVFLPIFTISTVLPMVSQLPVIHQRYGRLLGLPLLTP